MNDTISRLEAICAIEEYADRLQMVNWKENPGVPYKAYALNWAINTLRDLPSAERWIPVTERLPEEQGTYLVSGKWANKDEEIWICEFVRLCHIWGWCNEASRPVIQAWMPLPEPYKGGEEE